MASVTSDLARLIVRLGVGGVLAVDGYQKVQTWYRGRASAAAAATDPATTTTPTGRRAGLAAGVSEAAGGVMLVVGIATPATAAAAASSMALTATAATDGAAQGARFIAGGYEIPAALGVCAGALALAGPGRISVDHLLGNRLANRPAAIASLFATASTTALVLLRRYRAGSADKR
jgi:putative oxidoreductase